MFFCSYCSVGICNVRNQCLLKTDLSIKTTIDNLFFSQKCVKRNLPKNYTKEIECDDWRCFACKPEPIWDYRALCYAAQQYIERKKSQYVSNILISIKLA